LRLDHYRQLGGHVDHVVPLPQALARARARVLGWDESNPWPVVPGGAS
jgi:hypothetical protein